jgi:hypothetical protein
LLPRDAEALEALASFGAFSHAFGRRLTPDHFERREICTDRQYGGLGLRGGEMTRSMPIP